MKGLNKVGVLLPAVNDALEYELPRAVPPTLSLHFSRLKFTGATAANYERIVDDLPRAAALLAPLQLRATFFACTSGSLYGGLGFDQRIAASLSQMLGCPASTTSSAVIEAFEHLGARRVSVVTPYPGWVDALEAKFFEDHGFAVNDIRGLGLENCSGVGDEQLISLAQSVDLAGSDLLFISCTGLKTLHLLPTLRARLGVPVLSSNSVTLGKLCDLAGLDRPSALIDG